MYNRQLPASQPMPGIISGNLSSGGSRYVDSADATLSTTSAIHSNLTSTTPASSSTDIVAAVPTTYPTSSSSAMNSSSPSTSSPPGSCSSSFGNHNTNSSNSTNSVNHIPSLPNIVSSASSTGSGSFHANLNPSNNNNNNNSNNNRRFHTGNDHRYNNYPHHQQQQQQQPPPNHHTYDHRHNTYNPYAPGGYQGAAMYGYPMYNGHMGPQGMPPQAMPSYPTQPYPYYGYQQPPYVRDVYPMAYPPHVMQPQPTAPTMSPSLTQSTMSSQAAPFYPRRSLQTGTPQQSHSLPHQSLARTQTSRPHYQQQQQQQQQQPRHNNHQGPSHHYPIQNQYLPQQPIPPPQQYPPPSLPHYPYSNPSPHQFPQQPQHQLQQPHQQPSFPQPAALSQQQQPQTQPLQQQQQPQQQQPQEGQYSSQDQKPIHGQQISYSQDFSQSQEQSSQVQKQGFSSTEDISIRKGFDSSFFIAPSSPVSNDASAGISSTVNPSNSSSFTLPLPWTTNSEFSWPPRSRAKPVSRKLPQGLSYDVNARRQGSHAFTTPIAQLQSVTYGSDSTQSTPQPTSATAPATISKPKDEAVKETVQAPKETPVSEETASENKPKKKNATQPTPTASSTSEVVEASFSPATATTTTEAPSAAVLPSTSDSTVDASTAATTTSTPSTTSGKPKAWASLFKAPAAAGETSTKATDSGSAEVNPDTITPLALGDATMHALVDILRSYNVEANNQHPLTYLEPRGLVNGGNMCYMNSILQALLYCGPFYNFLDTISKKAKHSFQTQTPLMDAMITFLREFRVLGQGKNLQELRKGIQGKEQACGDPFTTNFFDVIRGQPRFSSIQPGLQQDAEEFLGLLLQELDDECAKVMQPSNNDTTTASKQMNGHADGKASSSDEWKEVVSTKQRSASSQLSGRKSQTPTARIFGGSLCSKVQVAHGAPSLTHEPFQPLQLDIGDPNVHNIVDALRKLTSHENVTNDSGTRITKQVLIEELPPVLILHLKRFKFDAEGGTTKVSKKVEYPLELEVPQEVMTQQARKRRQLQTGKLPRYRLCSVVYHHGKNACGGHYTVDVRRQDGLSWIRFDDINIELISPEDVTDDDVTTVNNKTSISAASSSSSTATAAMNGTKNGNDTVAGKNHGSGLNGAKSSGSSNPFDAVSSMTADDEGGWEKVLPSSSVGGGHRQRSSGAASGGYAAALANGANGSSNNNVNGSGSNTPGQSGPMANGSHSASPSRMATRSSKKNETYFDKKVAYILFYQRI